MIKAVLVEDCDNDARMFGDQIERFESEEKVKFQITRYKNGAKFISDYKCDADIIFMDIGLGELDGLETCRQLRKLDEKVIIVFITNLAQYAIKGYEVDALDFILKPVSYYEFRMKMKKVVAIINSRTENRYLLLSNAEVKRRVSVGDILYVEIFAHRIVYHFVDGGKTEGYGTLKEVENNLQGCSFVRCNSCYIVNVMHIIEVRASGVVVGGIEIPVSRSKHKEVLRCIAEYYGGGR